jgi:hypothetical protein
MFGLGFMGGIANTIRPAVQTDQTGVLRTQVTKSKSRLFIARTAQPEKQHHYEIQSEIQSLV